MTVQGKQKREQDCGNKDCPHIGTPLCDEYTNIAQCTGYKPASKPSTDGGSELEEVLSRVRETLIDRSKEYAGNGQDFAIFNRIAAIAGVDVDTVFRVLLALKMARAEANPEHIDTGCDLVGYAALYAAWRMQRANANRYPAKQCFACGNPVPRSKDNSYRVCPLCGNAVCPDCLKKYKGYCCEECSKAHFTQMMESDGTKPGT
jgi:predicted RNA-binding Zn-ribbon protein involved in translation (DUF1610 family)